MPVDRASNVETVSGVTPQGASLASNLASVEQGNKEMGLQAGLQAQRLQAEAIAQDKALRQQRELEEYRALIGKQSEERQIKANKENLKAELDQRDRESVRGIQLRKLETELTGKLLNVQLRKVLLRAKLQTELATGAHDAAEATGKEIQDLISQENKYEELTARTGARYKEAEELLKGLDGARTAVDGQLTMEVNKKRQAMGIATGQVLHDLVAGLAGDNYIPSIEGLMNKQGAMLASYVLQLSGVQADAQGEVLKDLNTVINRMGSGKGHERPDGTIDQSYTTEQEALKRLQAKGITTRDIGVAVSQFRRGLNRVVQEGVLRAVDYSKVNEGEEGAISWQAPDPEVMKARAQHVLSLFDKSFVNQGLAMGIPVYTNESGMNLYLDRNVAPLQGILSKVYEDLHADGKIDDPRLMQELQKFSPEIAETLKQKIEPIQQRLRQTIWTTGLDKDPEYAGIFGEAGKGGGVDLNDLKTRMEGFQSKKNAASQKRQALQTYGSPAINRVEKKKAVDAQTQFLNELGGYNDTFDDAFSGFQKGADKLIGNPNVNAIP